MDHTERVHVENRATHWPLALTDIALAAPIVSRLLLRASLPGRIVQAAALGAYVQSAVRDWRARQGIRRIDFRREFDADHDRLLSMPRAAREHEVRVLVGRVNDGHDDGARARIPRRELAAVVDRHLTRYIATITGQHVETSAEVRSFSVAKLVFPFALGACDPFSGDVAIFRDTGVFEPHIIAHEFSHRKGYWKELHAQVIAYLALAASEEPALVQAALCERLHRDLRVLAGESAEAMRAAITGAGLRPEIERQFLALDPAPTGHAGDAAARRVEGALRSFYDARMRLTGQRGISDYDLGFTDFLYTFETSDRARRTPPPAGVVHRPPGRIAAHAM